MHVEGRCHCGRITYEAEVDPATVTVCHCADCQMLTGTAYRTTVPAARAGFALRGVPHRYVKVADSGNRRVHAFCPNCGTPVYSTADVSEPAVYGLRVGCLKQRAQLPPVRQQWCDSAVPWSRDLGGLPGAARQDRL